MQGTGVAYSIQVFSILDKIKKKNFEILKVSGY